MEIKRLIDKIAWLQLENGRVLMALSHGKNTFYIPGGKREAGETDHETLVREVKEELSVDIVQQGIQYCGTFSAQAHGQPEGVVVQMTCYLADFEGTLQVSSEIAAIAYYSYSQRDIVGPVDQLIFDDLFRNNLLRQES